MQNKLPSEEANKGNIYDRIFKENAESLFIPLIEQQLNIKIVKYKALQEKISKTIEREMDFIYHIFTQESKEILLHIEFQIKDESKMIYRMANYHALVLEKYKMPIKHVVIYLGKGKAKMQNKLAIDERFEGFDLINIHELNTTQLITSQVPEIILLAFLSNIEKERMEAILRLTVTQLKSVCTSEQELRKYLRQLTILSRIRKLEEITTQIISQMPITYDITTDYLYQEGRQEGRQEGKEEGKEEIVIRCLEKEKPYEEIADITGLSIEEIKAIDLKRKNS